MLDVLRSYSTLVISWGNLEFRTNHTYLLSDLLDVLRSYSMLVISWITLEFRANHTLFWDKKKFYQFFCTFLLIYVKFVVVAAMEIYHYIWSSSKWGGAVEALLFEGAKMNFCQSLPRVFSGLAKFYVRNKHVIRATMHPVFPEHTLSSPDTFCLSRTHSLFPGHVHFSR